MPDRTLTIMYALGWTQHSVGSQMIRTAAMMQLLLGNIGMAGGGMNALRGHSNIQGLTDLGLLSNLLPGYLTLPGDKETDYQTYINKRAFKPLRPGQMSYWQNYGKFHVSLMKAWFGDAATKKNNWCFDWLPKLDKGYDVLQTFELMNQGKVNGYFCQGFNPLAAFPCKAKVGGSLAKLKYLVVIDPLATETSCFWENHGEHNNVDPAKIQTEVFRLPSTCFAEENGSLTNSGRWLQWHYKGANPPGEAKPDADIIAGIFLKLRELYKKEGGAFPDPILNLTWNYKIPHAPAPEELGDGIQRQGPGGRYRSQGQDQGSGKERPAAGRLRPAQGRRHHQLRLLAVLRLLDREGQHDGAAGQFRSLGPRQHAELGVLLACQPAHPVQPRLERPVRKTLGPEAQAYQLERNRMDRRGRARLQTGCPRPAIP